MSNLATLRPFIKNDPTGRKPPLHTKKGPYLTPILKKLLEKKISFEDPETKRIVEGKIKDVLMLRLILNGTEGETKAITEILDRLDGKVPNIIKDKTQDDELLNTEFMIIPNGNKSKAIEKFKRFLA